MRLSCICSAVGAQLPGSGLPQGASARSVPLRDAMHCMLHACWQAAASSWKGTPTTVVDAMQDDPSVETGSV